MSYEQRQYEYENTYEPDREPDRINEQQARVLLTAEYQRDKSTFVSKYPASDHVGILPTLAAQWLVDKHGVEPDEAYEIAHDWATDEMADEP